MEKLLFVTFCFLLINFSYSQTQKTILHDGLTREYIEYVPSIYDGSSPVPLVICLHGLGDNMNNFSNLGFHQIADTANFIVLTPQALEAYVYSYNMGTAWNSGASYAGIVLNENVDDLGFIQALIDTTASLYNIDIHSVFLTGFSMGGFMCNRLACELTDKITAIASVSGTLGNTITATPSHPIPVMHIHGTADGTVPYTGNQYGNDAEQLVSFYVLNNGCDMAPDIDSIPDVVNDGKCQVSQGCL
ncbi:MAG: hypothetical protein Kow0068_21800 [Marinilabiliales bacterium]